MKGNLRRACTLILTLLALFTAAILAYLVFVGGIEIRWGGLEFTCHKFGHPLILLVILLALRPFIARPSPFSRLGQWLTRSRQAILLGVFITVIAGLPRLCDLGGHSLGSDELLWMERGKKSVESLYEREFKKAARPFGHPGEVPGVLIGTSYVLLGRGSSWHSYNLIDPIVAARLPIALLGTATCILLFLIGRACFGEAVSFWAAIFLSLYPSHIALSRVAHLDSTLTMFFASSLLCYCAYAGRRAIRWKIASAIFWAFALLSKSPAFILPIILVAWKACLRIWDRRRQVRFLELSDLGWLGLGLGLYFSLYTKLWYDPAELHWIEYSSRLPRAHLISGVIEMVSAFPWLVIAGCLAFVFALMRAAERIRGGAWRPLAGGIRITVAAILLVALCLAFIQVFEKPLINQMNLASKVYTIENTGHLKYWMGRVVSRPPVWFYPFIFIVSTPPIMLFFLVCGIVLACGACLRRENGWEGYLLCLITPAVFTAVMSLGHKMGFRYIDPVIPFVCVLAAAGLMGLVDLLQRVRGLKRSAAISRAIHAVMAVVVVGSIAAPLWAIFPNCDLYYNFLIGGPAGAAKLISVGWGEGAKQAVEYIRAHAREEDSIYALGISSEFRFYWDREGVSPPCNVVINQAWPPHVDWLVIPLSHRVKRLEMQTLLLADSLPRAHSVTICGVDFAEIHHLDNAPLTGSHSYEAADLKTDARNVVQDSGAASGRAVLGRAGTPRGMLIHGPYARHGPGRWKAVFRVKRGNVAGEAPVASLSVMGISAGDRLNSVELGARGARGPGVYEEVPLEFSIDRARRLQFCVIFYGTCDLWVDRISLEKL